MPKTHLDRQDLGEPLRGLIHGPPGTGKSRLIYWICRCFTEALGWEHSKEFICIAYQNRVAHAMGGITSILVEMLELVNSTRSSSIPMLICFLLAIRIYAG